MVARAEGVNGNDPDRLGKAPRTLCRPATSDLVTLSLPLSLRPQAPPMAPSAALSRSSPHSPTRRDSIESVDSVAAAAAPNGKQPKPTSHARTPSSASSSSLVRPPLRNNFDLEPNPFEQSFSHSSTSLSSLRTAHHQHQQGQRSTASPTSDKKSSNASSGNSSGSHSRKTSLSNVPTVTAQSANGDTPKPILPPLASITSPSDPTYSWSFSTAGLTNSLRSGPLSPAMLAGPQTQPSVSMTQPAASIAALASSAAGVHPPLFSFDPSGSFRTGLTPSTGLTPLVGGPVAFPPPSPNTAAFLAMVNQSAGGGSAPTITPNTLNAITGVLNQHTATQQQQHQQQMTNGQTMSNGNSNGVRSSQTPPTQPATSVAPSQMSVTSSYGPSTQRYGITTDDLSIEYSPTDDSNNYQNAQNVTSHAANGLFLLSQAHQELTKREEAQKQSMAQASANNAEANGQANGVQDESASSKRGSKRKTDTANMPSAASATKPASAKRTRTASSAAATTRAAAARRGSTTASFEDDDDDMDDENDSDDELAVQNAVAPASAGSNKGGSKKPETEEEKRRNFLERNRQGLCLVLFFT